MSDILTYISDNFTLIKTNWLVFVIGWILFFIFGCVAQHFIHNITDEKWKQKYAQIEENYNKLKLDYKSLKDEFGKNDVSVLVGGTGNNPSPITTTMHSSLNKRK